jgi:hypothetical protein
MQFQITEPRTVTIRSVTSRVERHGEEKQPAVSIWLTLATPSTLLDMLDDELRGMFWRQPATGDLPGVEAAPPTELRCKLLKGPHKVEKAFDGYTMTICHIDGSASMTLDACKVNGFEFLPQPDGMCRLAFKVDAAEDDPETRGTLDTMLQREVDITLTAPTVRESPSATVTDIFAGTGNAEQSGSQA